MNHDQPLSLTAEPLFVDNKVFKSGGDYYFEGVVVAVFKKRNGVWRVVVENKDGVLHIFNPKQLGQIEDGTHKVVKSRGERWN